MSLFSVMPIEAFLDDRLSKTDLRVLGAIISFADKKGVCWPRREQISERCGLPVQKISYSTTRLIDFGWLKKEGNGGCSRSANYYVLKPDLISIVPESGTFIVPDLIVPESGTFIVPESGRGIKQTIEQTKRVSKHAREKLQNGFDDFWVAYPKKKSKDDALKAYLKINPDEQLQQKIIDAVILATTQDQDWLKDNGQYVPFPATYLNGKRWEDEITQKSPKTATNRNSGFVKQPMQRPVYSYPGDGGNAIDSTSTEIIYAQARL
jgi:Helix-turn-helix domain